MEKKKLTLSITSTKKTIRSIEEAKTQSKNSVIIEKKLGKFSGKPRFNNKPLNKIPRNIDKKTSNFFTKPKPSSVSDFEKRKLAEQRATKRLKGETTEKEAKTKIGTKKKRIKVNYFKSFK